MKTPIFPLGLISKKFSWLDNGYHTEIIEEVRFDLGDEPNYGIVLIANDSYKDFTSSFEGTILQEFKTARRIFIRQNEFEDFIRTHPFTLEMLKRRKNVTNLIREVIVGEINNRIYLALKYLFLIHS